MTDAPPIEPRKRKALSLFWAAGILVVIFFFLAAIATPKFANFQCRSSQSEAKGNLKALYVAEQSLFETTKTYSSDLSRIGFVARGQGRYLFGFVQGESNKHLSNLSSPIVPLLVREDVQPLLAHAVAGPKGFMAFAVGNIDRDETLDIWTISETSELENLVSDCAD